MHKMGMIFIPILHNWVTRWENITPTIVQCKSTSAFLVLSKLINFDTKIIIVNYIWTPNKVRIRSENKVGVVQYKASRVSLRFRSSVIR